MAKIEQNFIGKKYTVIFDDTVGELQFQALRYGTEWRDLCGDGLILAMLQRVEELQQMLVDRDVPICSRCNEMRETERSGQLFYCSTCKEN